MAKHSEFLRKSLGNDAIRASAEGVVSSLVATNDELVSGRCGAFGRGGKMERYPLAEMSGLRVLPNQSATVLEVRFAGGRTARLMYPRQSGRDFDQLVGLLQARLDGGEAPADLPAEPAAALAVVPGAVSTALPVDAAKAAKDARANRIALAMIMVPVVLVYVYSVFGR